MKVLVTGGSGFIGTNLIDLLLDQSIDVVNVDIKRPLDARHSAWFRECDILDRAKLISVMRAEAPTYVIHLAATTDTDGTTPEHYIVNTKGTSHVLDAIKETPGIERLVLTSTQFVHGPGPLPRHDEDYKPHTVYGESKVQSERLLREADMSCVWTIIRPTNVWGPWHPRYPREFWYVVKKGMYFHPGRKKVLRSYGYVGNVVAQIRNILDVPADAVNRKVLYLGDSPIDLFDWVNAFSEGLTGRPARVIPTAAVRGLALAGDAIRLVGIQFPIFTSRYQSMTQDYPTPMERTFETLGRPRFDLKQGVERTIQWLRGQDPFWS